MPADGRPSLAILPFAHPEADTGDEYLAHGLSEEIFARACRLEGVHVIAPASASRFESETESLEKIATELGVSAVVQGSVRRTGESLRVAVRLLDTGTGTPLWSGSYERSMHDLPAIGDDIVSQIAEVFDIRAAGVRAIAPPRPEAYECYLKGRYFWNRRTADGLHRAIDYFERAIEADAGYAQAYTGLADARLLLVEYASAKPREVAAAAREAILKALELDDSLAGAHASLGAIHFLFDWDAEAADRSFRRALELSPGYATAHHWFALHLAACRRFDDALSGIRLAQRGDPLSPILYAAAGWIAYCAGRPEMAVTEAQRSFELDPEFTQGHLILGLARLRMGQTEPALGALERAVAMSGQQPRVLGLLGYAYGLAGEVGAARAVLDQLDVLAESSYVPASRVALVHGSLGDTARMREWLDRAIEERDMLLPYADAILVDRPDLAAVLEESEFSYSRSGV
ncbi:MAG: hypothetical protein ACREK3_01865 [Gemmatimonadota bacterium]